MVGFPDLELIEKDLVQFIVVILSGMDEDMAGMPIELPDDST